MQVTKVRRRVGVALGSAVAASVLVLGMAVPANAWGSRQFPLSGCTGHANAFSLRDDGYSRHAAGTYESGNFCPNGRQLLSAGILRSNGVADSVRSGYTSVQTDRPISSVYTGGSHRAGGASTIT